MKTKEILLTVLAAVLLTSCSAAIEQGPTVGGLPINLGYSVVTGTEQTRAATNLNNDALTSGSVAVSVKKHSAGTYTTTYNYSAAAGGVLAPATASNQFYYETDGSSSDIIAYYPATATSTFSVQTNQTSDDNYKASDLMWAGISNQMPTNSTVNLQFSHKMSKIIVSATAGTGVTSITSVTLNNVKPKVDFTAADGTVSLASSDNAATNITMSNNGAALIPPQPINGNFITIVTPEGTAVYAVDKTFAAGHQYTLNITVNAAAIGVTNTITNWNSEGTVNVQPTVEVTNFDVADHAPSDAVAVDLGLPSGTKWANMNVGAVAETDYGTYFAWGETIGYTVSGSTDTAAANNQKTTDHSWANYWWGSSNTTLTKYVPEEKATSNGLNGFYDNKTQLELANDAARVNWGGNWRMPTQAEMDELLRTWPSYSGSGTKISGYTWTWCDGSSTKYNDSTVRGWKITRDEGGATIFLPAAGNRINTSVSRRGSGGLYWSSSLLEDYPHYAWGLYFGSDRANVNYYYRYYGSSVRAVCEE